MRALAPLLALGLVLFATPVRAEDEVEVLADTMVHAVRAHQNDDGSYGGGFVDTCRVLDLLGRSPRRYNDLDGPFVRDAARWVADAEGPDGWRVLALAGAVTSPLVQAREQALGRLRALPETPTDLPSLLALATFAPRVLAGLTPPAHPSAAQACLLAEDPAMVPAPEPVGSPAWTDWARAARLRGLQPTPPEELPAPDPSRPLPALLDTLALADVVNGLASPLAEAEGEEAEPPPFVSTPADLSTARGRALAWLGEHQQDGTFGLDLPGWSGPEPGVTALCLSAAVTTADALGVDRPDWIDQGLDYLVGLQHDNGGIYSYGVAVYTTSSAIEALVAAGRPEDADAIARARDYLVGAQADEGEGYDPQQDPHYGGIGYGDDERPDLSNTQFALEAATRAGLPQDSPLFKKALLYLERCQNLAETNSGRWPRTGGGVVVPGTDGGGTYMPGNSAAGEDELEPGVYVARSYGSMTYALTKSYLLCGLPADDPRVAAAVRWLVDHFDLDRNPGFSDPSKAGNGLYYYYLAMARTLRLLPGASLHTRTGEPLAWREALEGHLLAHQRVDGSWVNERSPRWFEGAPTLCTAYALLALEAADS